MFWSWFANITILSSNTLVPNSLELNSNPLGQRHWEIFNAFGQKFPPPYQNSVQTWEPFVFFK